MCSLHTREPAMPENISSTVANGCKDFLRGKCRKSVGAGGQNALEPITAASVCKYAHELDFALPPAEPYLHNANV